MIQDQINQVLTLKPNAMMIKIKKSSEMSRVFMERHPWAKTIGEAVYCARMNITSAPICEYQGCENPQRFLISGRFSYSRGCCSDHSMKISLLEKYGVEAPAQLASVREKMQATTLDRYGVAFAAQSPNLRLKMQTTCMNRHGSSFAATSSSVLANLRLKKFKKHIDRVSSIATPLFDAGDYINQQTPYRWKCVSCNTTYTSILGCGSRGVPKCPKCNPHNSSQAEREIYELVTSTGAEAVMNTRRVISPLELDIYVSAAKFALEFNGLYWHKDKSHLEKTKLCENQGIQLLQIFEDEWLEKRTICESIILSKLGKLPSRIFGRNCSIVEVNSKDAREFFISNHIQGSVSAKLTLGLVHESRLVACMSFGKSRYDKSQQWELLRFACRVNTSVVGGANKLWSHFIKTHSPESVISYADRRYSNGGLYTKLGFEYSHNSAPGYFYYKDGVPRRHSRIKFQKHKLKGLLPIFNQEISEYENMKANGYSRIWDCGNLVYKWKPSIQASAHSS